MGCDTILRLKGHVPVDDVLTSIRNRWDVEAFIGTKNATVKDDIPAWCKVNHDPHGKCVDEIYSIHFTYNGEKRMLFYHYHSANSYENIEHYERVGLRDMVVSETTTLNFGAWGSSVYLLTCIARDFDGGWLDENDCDDKEPYWVEPDAKKDGYLHRILPGGYLMVKASIESLSDEFRLQIASIASRMNTNEQGSKTYVSCAVKATDLQAWVPELVDDFLNNSCDAEIGYMLANLPVAFIYIPWIDQFAISKSGMDAEAVRAYTACIANIHGGEIRRYAEKVITL